MRQPNILDFSQYRRTRSFNPIFDLITDEFDNNFKEKSLSIDTVIKEFYTDVRSHTGVSDTHIMTLFAKGRDALTAEDEFAVLQQHWTGDESIYLLLGKKGLGKTMLLYRFYSKAIRGQIDGLTNQDLVVYLDLRDRRSDSQFKSQMPASLMEMLFYWIYSNRKYLVDPKNIKKLSPLYARLSDSDVCERVLNNKEEALVFLFTWLRAQGRKVFLIVDNLDDFDRDSIITIFDFCHRLKIDYSIKSCLALRDYWNPKVLKIDDKPVCTIMLPQPDIYEVIKKRISNIDHARVSRTLEFTYDGIQIALSAADLLGIFNTIIGELTQPQYRDLYAKLFRMTNYNTREFLINIYHYFHSPYLFASPNFVAAIVAKISHVDPEYRPDSARQLRLHDFIQGFMAIHSLCYDQSESTIFNLFHHRYASTEGFTYKNVLVFIRSLQVLETTEEATQKQFLLDQLSAIGYPEPVTVDALDLLLKDALVESIDGIDASTVTTIRLSAKGRLYLDELIYEFMYLLFISDAVPMEPEYRVDVNRKFGTEAIIFQRGNLSLKQESVRKFVDFVGANEVQEEDACPGRYREVLTRIRRGSLLHTGLRDGTELAIRYMTGFGGPHKHRGITSYRIKE